MVVFPDARRRGILRVGGRSRGFSGSGRGKGPKRPGGGGGGARMAVAAAIKTGSGGGGIGRSRAGLSSNGMAPRVWVLLLSLAAWAAAPPPSGFGRPVRLPSGRRTHFQTTGHRGPGSYRYGYDTGTGGPAQLFHQEERTSRGEVRGSYGYLDRPGLFRVVRYSADDRGFRVLSGPYLLTAEIPEENPYPPFVGPLPPFLRRTVGSRD
ncbi:pupal cuticle protein 20-like [Centruroides sculpturatus]|uniref:pupal cuticle protein 20-like n=1 Tax=Centruroides sculpturatus TaxID=218467 RepID=UPI000C6E3E79|nr:pupal cuticle protein 20-like [Centruroides sculpturatus]